jgi:hypothetical protein
MTLQQIELFVHESIGCGWLWYEMEVLGGEPTLHPELLNILACLREYNAFNPDCTILLVTNGYGPKVQHVLRRLPSFVIVQNTAKKRMNDIPFNAYNLAPVDDPAFAQDSFTRGCRIVAECGVGLTRCGFYLCGAGASVDRVFGVGLGISSLAQVTEERLFAQRPHLCCYCGHYKGRHLKLRTRDEVSPSWLMAYQRYRSCKPKLPLYGQSSALRKCGQ